jgi:hypothetical protein
MRWGALSLSVVWIVLYLAAYTAIFRSILAAIEAARRSSRFKKPHVLVLDGRLDDAGRPYSRPLYTASSPGEWHQALSSLKPNWTVTLGPADRLIENDIDILVNPFGEVIVEEDFALHTTLKRLTDWVHEGGVYVNVAGYPFWWQGNPSTGVTTEAGRWEIKVNEESQLTSATMKSFLEDRLLGISPDMNLGPQIVEVIQSDKERKMFGEVAGAGGSTSVTMFRGYPISTITMIPIIRTVNNSHIIIGSVAHGLGFFIFCGVAVTPETKTFDKVVAAIIGWSNYEAHKRRL